MKKTFKKFLQAITNAPVRVYASLAFSFIMFTLIGLIVHSLNIVHVNDNEEDLTVVSIFNTQEHILSLANKTVSENDVVLYTSYNDSVANMTISRAFEVDITADGQTQTILFSQGTVSDCLTQAGITLDEDDFTTPSLNTPITSGDSIRVYRVEYQDNQYNEVVPYETEYKSSSLIFRFKNSSYVLVDGQDGENLVTYRERYVDGELDYALVSNVEVVTKPVSELVLSYSHTAISPLPAPEGITIVNNVPSSYTSVISSVAATGYYSATGKGSSGLGLFYGSVAVNPNIIPYGSQLYITSPDGEFIYGFAIATDTGTALMEGIIGVDLFYETYEESKLNWKNEVNIYILN